MLDGFLQPEASIVDVFFYTHAVIIQAGKIILSHRVSLFGRCFKPFCSLGVVDRYAFVRSNTSYLDWFGIYCVHVLRTDGITPVLQRNSVCVLSHSALQMPACTDARLPDVGGRFLWLAHSFAGYSMRCQTEVFGKRQDYLNQPSVDNIGVRCQHQLLVPIRSDRYHLKGANLPDHLISSKFSVLIGLLRVSFGVFA